MLRITAGTAPFDDLDTTYGATAALYYAGGLVGGTLVGLFLPIGRSLWGAALLGILGVFPFYLGVALTKSRRANPLTPENIGGSALLAFLTGGAVGVWIWLDEHPMAAGWIEALRHPTSRTLSIVWAVALAVGGASYFGLSRWTPTWPPTLVIFLAFVLFVMPLALAAFLTLIWARTPTK